MQVQIIPASSGAHVVTLDEDRNLHHMPIVAWCVTVMTGIAIPITLVGITTEPYLIAIEGVFHDPRNGNTYTDRGAARHALMLMS